LKLGFGTSEQIQVSGPEFKRSESLHHPGKADRTVDINPAWKSKHSVPPECNPPRTETTHQRIFVPASNVERKKEEGCMNKIKIERAQKLVREDQRGRSFNILSGHATTDKVWINAMGKQADLIK
jgi:hypothetical protein